MQLLLPPGTRLHRVHQSQYEATAFNPGRDGNARFSPIQDAAGNAIPILYGGSSKACALMETVFRDVPHITGFKSLDKGKLAGLVYSSILVEQDLHLTDLTSVALRRLGVERKQLIDTEKDQYPATRLWAASIHRQCQQVQGLYWISRQDDSAWAVMLFGDRIPEGALAADGVSSNLLDHGNTDGDIVALADRLGVNLVDGLE